MRIYRTLNFGVFFPGYRNKDFKNGKDSLSYQLSVLGNDLTKAANNTFSQSLNCFYGVVEWKAV